VLRKGLEDLDTLGEATLPYSVKMGVDKPIESS
jgi:hypothetical protein